MDKSSKGKVTNSEFDLDGVGMEKLQYKITVIENGNETEQLFTFDFYVELHNVKSVKFYLLSKEKKFIENIFNEEDGDDIFTTLSSWKPNTSTPAAVSRNLVLGPSQVSVCQLFYVIHVSVLTFCIIKIGTLFNFIKTLIVRK